MKWEIAILIKEFCWKMIDQFYIPIMKLHKYVTVWRVIEMKVQLQWSLFFKMINCQQQKKQNVYLIHTNEADVSSLCTHMRFFDAQIFLFAILCNFMQFSVYFICIFQLTYERARKTSIHATNQCTTWLLVKTLKMWSSASGANPKHSRELATTPATKVPWPRPTK